MKKEEQLDKQDVTKDEELLAGAMIEPVPLERRTSERNTKKDRFAEIVVQKLKKLWSGLTDVRTVSDELTDSTMWFDEASDQTMNITQALLNKEDLQKMIKEIAEAEYDLKAADKYQKSVQAIAKMVINSINQTF